MEKVIAVVYFRAPKAAINDFKGWKIFGQRTPTPDAGTTREDNQILFGLVYFILSFKLSYSVFPSCDVTAWLRGTGRLEKKEKGDRKEASLESIARPRVLKVEFKGKGWHYRIKNVCCKEEVSVAGIVKRNL